MSSITSLPVLSAGLVGFVAGELVHGTSVTVSKLISGAPTRQILIKVSGTLKHQKEIAELPKHASIRLERDAKGSEHHTKVYLDGKHIGDLPDSGRHSISKVLYENFMKGKKVIPKQWFRTGHGKTLEMYLEISLEK